MKYLLLGLIKIYQLIPGTHHYKCKFRPTCSNYSIIAIREYGSIKGIYLTIKRLLRCNPWNKGGYDPVPKKENLNEKN